MVEGLCHVEVGLQGISLEARQVERGNTKDGVQEKGVGEGELRKVDPHEGLQAWHNGERVRCGNCVVVKQLEVGDVEAFREGEVVCM